MVYVLLIFPSNKINIGIKTMTINILITANVFHNSLPRLNEGADLFNYYLSRLQHREDIKWYISSVDYDSIQYFWDNFGDYNQAEYREAYLGMMSILKQCEVTPSICEEARLNQFYSVSDSIRLACAIDRNVDAIVTYEPHHFVRDREEEQLAQDNNHFILRISSEQADLDELEIERFMSIKIFSPRSFLLHFDQDLRGQNQYENSKFFNLFQFRVELDSQSEHDQELNLVNVTLFIPSQNKTLEGSSEGRTPIDALQKAIHYAISDYLQLSNYKMTQFQVYDSPQLNGADGQIEVFVGLDCEQGSFSATARSSNFIRAAGESYINIINQIMNLILN